MINPEVLWASEELFKYEEGCLSLPEQYADVIRPKQVRIKYLDKEGHSRIMEAEDLLAVCLQHEIDHLEGILFVDHISMLWPIAEKMSGTIFDPLDPELLTMLSEQ